MQDKSPIASHTQAALPLQRRTLLRWGSLALLLGRAQIAWGASIVAVRLWPADEYTRLTIESDSPLKFSQELAYNPPRVVVDIEGLDLNAKLQEIVGRVQSDDPYISKVRVGQNRPGVVRLVVDLKQAVKPQVFTLPPVAAYGNRLVLDLYPVQERDPLEVLLADMQNGKTPANKNQNPHSNASTLASAANKAEPDALGDFLSAQHSTTNQSDQHRPLKGRRNPRFAQNAGTNQGSASPTTPPVAVTIDGATPPAESDTWSGARRGGSGVQRLIIVALDPGHGGEDPGATGPAGTHEKDIVLQIAKRVQARINASSVRGNPMRAFMTRDEDYFVPLGKRVEKARGVRADLFVSIHADAFTTPEARGASVFALSEHGASSAAARWLAGTQNESDAVGGLNIKADRSVRNILADMSVSAQIRDSMKLGAQMLRSLGSFAKLHKGRVEQAGFAVLKAPDIPSVLVETAFISNPEEEQRLRDTAYQDELADGIMRGISQYFAANPPEARGRST